MSDAKVNMTIPIDEIVHGATVRFTVKDGIQYISIRDIIIHMCDKDNDRAGAIWRNLRPEHKEELRLFLSNFKFFGQGQSEQPVITFPGALTLCMFLPGEHAKNNRAAMSKILHRYFAGDQSLLKEIEANAASDSPIAKMARASLPSTGGHQETMKHKRELLEIEDKELDILEKRARRTNILALAGKKL